LATASAQVCVPLGHSSLINSVISHSFQQKSHSRCKTKTIVYLK